MPQDVEAYLRTLKSPDPVKADAWDAVYAATDDADAEARLKRLPVPNAVRAQLWDMREAMRMPMQPKRSAPPLVAPGGGRSTRLDLQGSYDFARGARAGAASTVFHGGDVIRRGLGMERVIDTPEVQSLITPPDSARGRIGFYGEQALEFGVPLARVTRAVKAAPLVTRMAAEGAASTGVATVQSGGDPGAMVLAGTVGAGLPAAGALVRTGARTAQRAAAGAREGGFGGAVASAVRTAVPSEPRTMLVQALKPRASRVNFPATLDRAMPELKSAESLIGRPIEDLDSMVAATKAAKANIQDQLTLLRGPQRAIGAEVDLAPVADAMVRSIPKKLQLEHPAVALRLQNAADVYRGRFTLDDAETLLRETNAELDGLYAMFPGPQRAALTSNPAAATLNAQAGALRAQIYRKLDDPGQGAAARELNRRYGSLIEVEDEIHRRTNVARRQQPESLSEQIGAVRAAADMARGIWKVTHGNMMGAADIAAASAGRSAAKAIKDSQTTDALIRRAFAGYNVQPTPVVMPTPRPVRGALGPGPIITPPPADPSGGRGVSAWNDVQYSGTPRQLPEGRTVRPMPGTVPPDPSGGHGIPAAPITYDLNPLRPVKQGGFRVSQFSGDPEAAAQAIASPEVRTMLERMKNDLEMYSPQQGRIVRDSAAGDTHYVPGTKGSSVADDVRVISEQNVSNRKIQQAVEDLLAGKKPTNRLHTAALDAAMGYLEKRPGYVRPSAPTDAEFDAWSSAIDDLR